MALFDELRAKVQSETDAVVAMTAVLNDLKDKFDDAIANAGSLSASDRADLQSIVDGIGTETDQIVADTVANTPAEPPAP